MTMLLENVLNGEKLSFEDSARLFSQLVKGDMSDVAITSLLVAMKVRGETPAEIAGAAHALRLHSEEFPRPDYLYADCCGTGGDGTSTINISTIVAFVCAAAGLPVAKHGNRSVSSKCGSADVLEASGIALDLEADDARDALDENGFCFLFAPHFHKGVRHVMPVRKELATRTVFNLLGPLINPARPPVQLMGVYDPVLCRPVAETLNLLGTERAIVVHGSGLDEVAVHGPTTASIVMNGEVRDLTLTPADFGLKTYDVNAISGGEVSENLALMRCILDGKGTDAQNAYVAANAGALLHVAGRAASFRDGAELALELLKNGRAKERFEKATMFQKPDIEVCA